MRGNTTLFLGSLHLRQFTDKGHFKFLMAIPLLVKYNVEQDEKPFVIPPESEEEEKNSAFGALAKYANPAMIPFEDGAWERAVVKKYVKNIG